MSTTTIPDSGPKTALVRSRVETIDAEIIDDTPTPRSPEVTAVVNGLLNLAAMIDAHPQLLDGTPGDQPGHGAFRYTFSGMHLRSETRADVAAITRIAMRYGAKVEKVANSQYAGVDLHFGLPHGLGQVTAHVWVEREEICERIVTGTKTVTKQVPDPAAPLVTVTETVEEVEWRCRPILPDELPAATVDGARR